MYNLPLTWNHIGWIIFGSSLLVSYGILQIDYTGGIISFAIVIGIGIIAGIVITAEWCEKNVRVRQ